MDNKIRDSILKNIGKIVQIGMVLIVCSAVAVGQDRMTQVEKNSVVYNGIPITQDAAESTVLNKIISVTVQDAPLLETVEKIAVEANLEMVYNSKLLTEKNRTITTNLEQVTVEKAIWAVLKETGLRFAVSADKQLVLMKRKEAANLSQGALAKIQETITGTVTDGQSGETLPGVNILVKGTSTGASTDSEGNFELTVPSLQDTLVVTYIGYQRQEVPVNGQTEINIQLTPQAIAGKELIVVGYGTQSRETLSGSVSSISGESLEQVPVTNISNSITGRIPGITTVNSSGEPGYNGASINIRGIHTLGNNSPLVVIDGVPNRSGGLDRLSPEDIENISVLKDASAAIYGAQAANGVILVTTKRGNIGAPEFNLKINQGFNQPTRLPEMADAATYLTMLNEIDIYNNREPAIPQETIENHRNQTDPWLYPDTDYFDEVIKPMSFQSKASLTISGGSEAMRYFLSFSGLTEDGYYENSSTRYNQYQFRSNLDGQVTDNITLSFDVSGRLEDRNFPTIGAGTIFGELQRGKPNQHLFWPNGQPAPNFERGRNPAIITTDESGYLNDERYYLQSNLKLDIEIPSIEGLSFTANATYDKDFRERKEWQTPWDLYAWDFSSYDSNGDPILESNSVGYPEPRLSSRVESGHDILLNFVGNYEKDLGDHSFSFLLGTEKQRDRYSYLNAYRRHYISSQIDQLFAGGEAERTNDGNASQGIRLNYFSRANYSYQNKYLLEFIARYDGSYIFPEEGRFGFFPAVSAGYRITQEDWFDVNFIDELKVRASWGQTGNDRINEWQYLTSYGFGGGFFFGSAGEEPSIYPQRVPNPNITWEVANQFDIGLEASVLDNRLSLEVDYFNYLREDILAYRNASVPQSTGISLPRENIGEVKSWGYEGSINWQQQVNSDLLIDLNMNVSYAENKIQYWDEPPGAPEWQRSTGSPMNTGLYYKANGVFETQEDIDNYPHWPGAQPGDIRFDDVNDDGVIDADDRIRINRTGLPKWTGGITLGGRYKSFDMSVFFQGAAGASQYVFSRSGELGNYFQDFAEKRWTPDNPNPDHPRAFNRQENYWADNQNTYFLRKADYIRLKNLEIGYSLPANLSSHLGIQRMRVYANGYNLLTWDTLKVFDPEARNATANYYPQKRTVNVGLSITF